MNIIRHAAIFLIVVLAIAIPDKAMAKDDIGTIVAVRGKTIIERDKKDIDAKLRDKILLKDTVSTMEASKAKMLFIDDSVLTIGEKSKAVINEFFYSKEKGGKSIFNLIDGKMRTVVGKTDFEVHTPTAVAAARGTVIHFEVGKLPADKLVASKVAAVSMPFKYFTTILCIVGEVLVRSSDPNIPGFLTLYAGMMATIHEGAPLPPSPSRATPAEIGRMQRDIEIRAPIITDAPQLPPTIPPVPTLIPRVPPLTTPPPTTPPPTTPPPTTPPPTTPPPTTPPPSAPPWVPPPPGPPGVELPETPPPPPYY